MVRIDSERLRFELARRGLSQQQLALDAGVTPETLSRALGGRGVRLDTLAKVAAALLEQPVLQGVEILIQEPQ